MIFTSGSTGTPKGVAVSTIAAAFVDAESRMFLRDRPIEDGDRLMAGLSVAFDASCEDVAGLGPRRGASSRAALLVRSGVDVGPWLVANAITVVSTVPTLVMLWPTESLAAVRLLILGGEACPPEIGERLAHSSRGIPTEPPSSPASWLSTDGLVRMAVCRWTADLAVVGGDGLPVTPGEVGELIIGGVGLARYLDPSCAPRRPRRAPRAAGAARCRSRRARCAGRPA